jgi:hypothetical protein
MDAFSKALKILKGWRTETTIPTAWFRGVCQKRRLLIPGAYRQTDYDEEDPLLDLQQQGAKFAKIDPHESWSNYYLAQHYGIPTRLLDWSESFSAALFFALDGAQPKDTPVVWILNPCSLNKHLFKWDGLYIPEGREPLKIWLPSGIKIEQRIPFHPNRPPNLNNQWPIAILPRQDIQRIQMQKGQFTVHGRDTRPLDKIILSTHPFPHKVIARIDLKLNDKDEARDQLALLGVTRGSIYPDMDNYVKELKQFYEWK